MFSLFFFSFFLFIQVVSGSWITLKHVSLSSYQKQRLICFAWACLAGWRRMSCETRWRCSDVLGDCHLTGRWTCEEHSCGVLIIMMWIWLQIPWRRWGYSESLEGHVEFGAEGFNCADLLLTCGTWDAAGCSQHRQSAGDPVHVRKE